MVGGLVVVGLLVVVVGLLVVVVGLLVVVVGLLVVVVGLLVVVVGVVVVVVGVVVVVVVLVDEQVGTVMVSEVVETVPPNARALPVQVTVLPTVTPEASMSVPAKVDVAPRVVAAAGVQYRSQAEAPLANVTEELATVVRAPSILKMKVPLPLRVIPAVPIDAALVAVVQ